MFRTEICDLLGIEYPIIQGGMVWVGYSELCAAVSEAGGFGVLSGGSMTAVELKEQIIQVKEKTKKPFGVNIPIMMPWSADLVKLAVEEKLKAVFTSAGSPKKYTAGIKEAGLVAVHVSPSATLAVKAAQAGVDAVVAEGIEAGGHNGFEEITTMALVPQVAELVEVPVIAAGGIADGRGFAAALALGAKGVQLGTRFAATKEALGHPDFKKAIVEANDKATVITGRKMGPTRCIRNKLAETIMDAEQKGATLEELFNLIGTGRSKRAAQEGEIEDGTIYCGQIAGLIKELKNAGQVVEEIISTAEILLKDLAEMSKR